MAESCGFAPACGAQDRQGSLGSDLVSAGAFISFKVKPGH